MIEQWATLNFIPVCIMPKKYRWWINVYRAAMDTIPAPYPYTSYVEMPEWSSELKYLMNQLINNGWNILKIISSKNVINPRKRNFGPKALMTAFSKLDQISLFNYFSMVGYSMKLYFKILLWIVIAYQEKTLSRETRPWIISGFIFGKLYSILQLFVPFRFQLVAKKLRFIFW